MASGSIPAAPGSPACGREPLRSQLARALGLQRARHAEDAPADRDDPRNDLSLQLWRRHVYAAETTVYQALSAGDLR